MKLNTTIAILIGIFILGCKQEPAPEASAEATPEASPTETGWLTQAMATPAYIEACKETPGCGDLQEPASLATEGVWRVQVIRGASGDLRIGRVDIIDVVAGDGVPVGALSGMYALVGLGKSGKVIDGQVLRFAESLRVEYDSSTTQDIDLSGKEVDTLAYIKASPAITKLAIQGKDGAQVDSTENLPWPEPATKDPLSRLLGISPAWAVTRPFQGLPPYCSHIIVLQGEEDRRLAAGSQWEEVSRLGTPGPYQLAATRAALGRMTPMLCQSIGRIVFAYVTGFDNKLGAVNSQGAGDTIVINISALLSEQNLETMANRRLMLQQTVVHEAGHTAETLLTVEGSDSENQYSGAWGFPPRTLANKTIENVRLEMGLPAEWQRMHESFVTQDWAEDYGEFPEIPDEPPEWTPAEVVHGGFISRYASDNWAEDIADTINHAYYSRIIADAYEEHGVSDYRQDFACREMQKHQKRDLPSRFAAVYAKLHFLQDLGLVRPEGVKDCTGDMLGLPIDSKGFHVWQEAMRLRSFTDRLKAGIGATDLGVNVFEMTGYGEAAFSGSTYPTKVKLRLDLDAWGEHIEMVSWPRGVYELGLAGNNNFTLRLDGAHAGNFDAMDGFVVVAEASNERIAGSVVLQRVFRLQAPMPVPEKYDPPLIVRFLMEK